MQEYRHFASPAAVADWVALHYTEGQLQALCVNDMLDSPLLDYKGGSYRDMNTHLRMGVENLHSPYDISGLQKLLKGYQLPEGVETHRFVCWKEWLKLFWNTRHNRVYTYPSFLSTTLLKDYYSMDEIKKGRIVITILAPCGSTGTYLPEVNEEAPEFEILFPHHTSLRRISFSKYQIVNNLGD